LRRQALGLLDMHCLSFEAHEQPPGKRRVVAVTRQFVNDRALPGNVALSQWTWRLASLRRISKRRRFMLRPYRPTG